MFKNLINPIKSVLRPTIPKDHQIILNFKIPNELDKCMTRSDAELGGYSTVALDMDPKEESAHFHGYLNLDPPENRPDMLQSGYAMFRTKDQPQPMFLGEQFWDWSLYTQLALRVKGDHRKYLINLQADSSLKTDVFQHRLFLNSPGEWETVLVPLNNFVLTNWGIVQDDGGLDKSKVKTFGVGLLDRQFGPFSLHIDWVKVITGKALKNVVDESRNEKTKQLKEGEEADGFDFGQARV